MILGDAVEVYSYETGAHHPCNIHPYTLKAQSAGAGKQNGEMRPARKQTGEPAGATHKTKAATRRLLLHLSYQLQWVMLQSDDTKARGRR